MSQFNFMYRCSDITLMVPLATPVTVIAESREQADEKMVAVWGHTPKYVSLVGIEEATT